MNWPQLLNPARRRPTTSTGDHRIEFERDFDRAVFSSPVKRLQDKAQVFPLEPNDAIRTRLTHSLEVSSVARGLARGTAKWLLDTGEISAEMDRSIEAIAATCGLVHDLGNPPFGHAGEDAIRSWFQRPRIRRVLRRQLANEEMIQDFLRFDGNAQSLRLVATLQVLADYTGLNFTYGTLSALMKYVAASHEADRNDPNRAFKKPGFFASEAPIVADIREQTGTGKARNPISFLVEAADDIVYLAADVEDGVKKGVISWRAVEKKLNDNGSEPVSAALNGMRRILMAGRSEIPEGLQGDIFASAFRTAAIGVMVAAASDTFKRNYVDIMSGQYGKSLTKDSAASSLEDALRTVGVEDVYPAASTLKLELMGRHVICDLMDLFWEGAQAISITEEPSTSTFAGKSAALFSPNYRRVFRHFAQANAGLPEDYHRLQLVTDYVCGMTDTFAKRLHAELFNRA